MSQTLLFCAVFASQLLVVSLFLPRRATMPLRYVLQHCPPATHPKLYPRPREYYERALRNFVRLNLALGVAGLAIIVAMLAATLRGGWDGQLVLPWSASGQWHAAIITPFFLLQMVPFAYFDMTMAKHYAALAKLEPPRQRAVELYRRRLQDFISRAMLGTTVLVQAAFIVFLLDYRRHEFSWFTATGNILGVVFLDLLLILLLVVALRGRRQDHFETARARAERMRRVVRPIWMVGIAMPALVTVQLLLKLDEPWLPEFVFVSAFVQAIAIALHWSVLTHRPAQIDFDVYRQDTGVRS